MGVWAEQALTSSEATIQSASNCATVLAALLTLLTLLFLVRQTRCQMEQADHVAEQTRLLNDQAKLAVSTNREVLYQNVMKEMQEISRIFLHSPELRCYFYDGCPVPHEGELRVRVQVLSEMLVDFMGFTLNTCSLFSEDEKSGWATYFADIARSSPAIRMYWRNRRDWYEQPVQHLLDPVIDAILDDSRSGGLASAS